ncbi:Endothelial zinc finger protein induced by like protein [Argiope bruennichi]|uniref:Endothelial zinc finger protein induced by like protein n=1 Tax=Argiope bruennichi TaxID=94029 RepID=A0A8T0FFR8_ARGBR|nr:Endothelial zinc finger protein induced by like protein [Argiope bruennichi]
MESAKRRRENLFISTGGNHYWYDLFHRRSSIRSNRQHLHSRILDSQYSGIYAILFFLCLFPFNSGILLLETDPPEDSSSKCKTLLPECECDDNDLVAGLVCQNVSNFDAFTKILKDGSLFEKWTTYEIKLSGTRILPQQFLKGLIVYRLLIDDPLTEGLEDGAFDGVLRLKKFHVRKSSIKEIPDFWPIRNSLRSLSMNNSLLTSIHGAQLKNLTHLETLFFANNSIRHVAPDAFQGTNNLIIFDISYNLLRFLPPNLFHPMKKLKKVVLSYNFLLHVDQLFAVTHPQFIYLDHNNLTDLDSVLHGNMIQVETVQLSYNPFTKVTMNSFMANWSSARFLYLDHCLIQEFNVGHYISLNNLSTLDLSFNFIEKVVNQTISFGKNIELDFTGNKITEFEGNPLWCDCQLLPFLKHLNSTKKLKTDVPICIPPNDTTPGASIDKRPGTPARCPDGCRCFCKNNGDNYYIFVDCNNNGLTELPPLFAAANFTTPEHIPDINETRCGPDEQDSPRLANRAIWTLSDIELCATDVETYVSVALSVLAVVVVASAMSIVWIRYKTHIKAWLYAHGMTWVKEQDIDQDKEFDAFFSFSFEDWAVVFPDIFNVIEKKVPNIRLCFPCRDFRPCNEDIYSEIVRCLESSRQTVLVLSRNFLKSELCMFQFKTAHVLSLKDHGHRIIIIKMGDLPKEKDLPKEIQIYLKSHTRLTWGDRTVFDKAKELKYMDGILENVNASLGFNELNILLLGTEYAFEDLSLNPVLPDAEEIATECENRIDPKRVHIQPSEKPYVYVTCGVRFRLETTLSGHLQIHSREKFYQCKHNSRYRILVEHLNTRTKKRTFVCPQCSKAFECKISFTNYAVVHSGKKSHICGRCGRGFSTRQTLVVHFRTLTGERPHVGKTCEKAFIQKISLTSHKKQQDGIITYACKV